MLQNAYLLAKIGADTAENERNFAGFSAKILRPARHLEGGAREGAGGFLPQGDREHGGAGDVGRREADPVRAGELAKLAKF